MGGYLIALCIVIWVWFINFQHQVPAADILVLQQDNREVGASRYCDRQGLSCFLDTPLSVFNMWQTQRCPRNGNWWDLFNHCDLFRGKRTNRVSAGQLYTISPETGLLWLTEVAEGGRPGVLNCCSLEWYSYPRLLSASNVVFQWRFWRKVHAFFG